MLLTKDGHKAFCDAHAHLVAAAQCFEHAKAECDPSLAWVIEFHLEDVSRRARNIGELLQDLSRMARLDGVAEALDAGTFREGEDAEGVTRIEVNS